MSSVPSLLPAPPPPVTLPPLPWPLHLSGPLGALLQSTTQAPQWPPTFSLFLFWHFPTFKPVTFWKCKSDDYSVADPLRRFPAAPHRVPISSALPGAPSPTQFPGRALTSLQASARDSSPAPVLYLAPCPPVLGVGVTSSGSPCCPAGLVPWDYSAPPFALGHPQGGCSGAGSTSGRLEH